MKNILICLFCFIFCCPMMGQLGTEKFINFLSNEEIRAGTTLTVQDDKFGNKAWEQIEVTHSVKNAIIFEINEDEMSDWQSDLQSLTYILDLQIEYWEAHTDLKNAPTKVIYHSLSIAYDTTAAHTIPYKAFFEMKNAHQIRVKIVNIKTDGGVWNGQYPPLRLSAEIIVHRNYLFSCTDRPLFMPFPNSSTVQNDNYMVGWSAVSGAEEYDLEWAFYDEQSIIGQKVANGSNQAHSDFGFLFRHNATRVTISSTQFTTPLLYPTGYLFYRIRAVRTLNGIRETGEWTSQMAATISGFPHKIKTGWHESNLNWQAQTSFAEEGKHVPSVRYFDGSLRERQSVTRSNVINQTIASQTIYDHQGRPAMSTMPAPTSNPTINYNPLQAARTATTPYTKSDFDTGNCNTIPPPLHNSQGVGKYYSPNNPAAADTEGFQRFVPDAEGYPFTVTEYTPDLTGRIKRQSGVGEEHRLGGGHETKYFYGKPAQEELDRLFGNEVGFASHYFKNMVQDANGQLSISYVDAHGRTVATALAGDSPTNVDELDNRTAEEVLVRDLLNNVASTYTLTSTYSMLVTNNGDYTFDYDLDTARYKPVCLPTATCYDCLYDLTITITDNCGNGFNSGQPYVVSQQNYTPGSTSFNTLCSTDPAEIMEDFTLSALPPGEYMVTKTLTVSREALEYYADQFITESTCIPAYTDLLTDFQEQIDVTGCNLTCEECLDQLGGTGTAEEIAACNALCAGQNECQNLFDLMAADVSPNGQYALFQSDGIILSAGDAVSIYNNNGHQNLLANDFYPDENGERDSVFVDGVLVSPTELNVTDFITYWKPSWAAPLVRKYHPEYCYYQWCLDNEDSASFDSLLLEIDSYQDAVNLGLVDASGNIMGDPFFENGGAGEDYDSLLNYMLAYGGPQSCAPLTMTNLASALAYCGGDSLNCPTLFGQGCTADNDLAWQILQGLYLGIKYQIKSEIWANLPDCDNACIGNGTDNCMTDDCQNGGVSLCDGSTNPYKNKQARAVRITTPDIPGSMQDYYDTQTATQQTELTDWCADVCAAHADFWIEQLEGCDLNQTQKGDLRLRLIAVCELGCDATHPFGASTTPSGQTTSFGDSSFDDALTAIIGSQTVCSDCNANLIDFPGTYDTPVWSGAPLAISEHFIDSCLCIRYTELEACYNANASAYNNSFSEFLSAFANIQVSDADLADLKTQCNETNCAELPDGFIVPPMMECSTCYTCEEVETLVTQFEANHCTPSNPNYEAYRTRWLNEQLGFTLTAEDYAAKLTECSSLAMCDDLRLFCPNSAYGAVQIPDECVTSLLAQAEVNAQIAYERIIDSLREEFVNKYLTHCLSGLDETFTYSGAYNEYHFTLYYYDQAGNLVKTIPPKGVMPLTSQMDLDNVKNYRNTEMGSPTYPNHTFKTKYVYNSLNEVIRQVSPDATESQFWYDRVGRLVVSQDGRQSPNDWYSYTIFDAQGRIIEVGEITQATAMTSTISRDPAGLDTWISAGTKNQVTKTYYDREVFTITSFGMNGQENLRSRVASVTIEAADDANDDTYDYATHYSYDASGNVKTLVQEIKDLHQYGHGYKRIDYDYDYISGNVNMVSYQKDSTDQFFHKYTYDETNRLTIVETNLVSDDPLDSNWERDAEYEYYLHGPLARTEIGERRVQGMDYAYTIQGWIKGMNSSAISEDRDMGKDGKTGTTHDGVAKDAVAYSIGYFEDDYKPISTVANTNFELSYNGTGFANSSNSLYNGNIRNIMLHLRQFDNAGAYAYSYDQLHRIKQMKRWETPNLTSWNWSSGVETDKYKSLYSFDPNGNITLLDRYDENGAAMDLLQFRYDGMVNNRLLFVDDTGGDKTGFEDATDQDGGNYSYNDAGSMISDVQSGSTIEWSVYNKPLKVDYPSENRAVLYNYGPDKNRIIKAYITNTTNQDTTFTYYIRGAQGNIMAIYERESINITWKEQHLYGSNRLGTLEPNVTWIDDDLDDVPYFENIGTLMEGWKKYELTNYLGNVLTVINDVQSGGLPTIISATDYFPFGLELPSRSFNLPTQRFTFNGKEVDREVGWQDYGFRMFPQKRPIPRFPTIDPIGRKFPELSPYQFAGNSPIQAIDLDGLEPSYLLNNQGKLPQPVITLLNAAFDYNIDALKASKWISFTNANYFGKLWIELTGYPNATVSGKKVYFDPKLSTYSDNYWLELIAHEELHRQEVTGQGSLGFYSEYLLLGGINELMAKFGVYPSSYDAYKSIPTEDRAFEKEDLIAELLKIQTTSFNSKGSTKSQNALDILSDNTIGPFTKNQAMKYIGLSFKLNQLDDLLNQLDDEINNQVRKDVESWAKGRFDKAQIEQIIQSFQEPILNFRKKVEMERNKVDEQLKKL